MGGTPRFGPDVYRVADRYVKRKGAFFTATVISQYARLLDRHAGKRGRPLAGPRHFTQVR